MKKGGSSFLSKEKDDFTVAGKNALGDSEAAKRERSSGTSKKKSPEIQGKGIRRGGKKAESRSIKGLNLLAIVGRTNVKFQWCSSSAGPVEKPDIDKNSSRGKKWLTEEKLLLGERGKERGGSFRSQPI